MKRKVLVSAPYMLPLSDLHKDLLESNGIEIIIVPVGERLSEMELLPLIGDIDGVICGDDQFTERVLQSAPKLRVISKWGTGIDSIDSQSAGQLGIRICNTPGAFTDPVADTVMGYILLFARGLDWLNREMREGRWVKYQGVALRECTLGIIGLGDVGKAVAKRASSFGMEILATDIVDVSHTDLNEINLSMVPMGQLLQQSDYVSLNCTLNSTSNHLISDSELSLMKNTAYLINTCRGPVIRESALAYALENGIIRGAALDVFEIEPLPYESPLLPLENCFMAPHNANSSPSAWERVHENSINNLFKGLDEVTRS